MGGTGVKGRGGTAALGGGLLSAAAQGMGGPAGPPSLLHVPHRVLCLLCLLPPLLKVSVGCGDGGLFSGWGCWELELCALLTARGRGGGWGAYCLVTGFSFAQPC